MKYCWTTLHVEDIEKSIEFYQKIIGLSLNRRFEHPTSGKFAFLGEGETQIELIQAFFPQVTVGNAITIGFAVGSLERAMKEVKDKGIGIESGPFQPNDHIRFFYILDPNGIRIQISESF